MSLNVFLNDKNLAEGDSFTGLVPGGLKRPSDVRALGGFFVWGWITDLLGSSFFAGHLP